MDFQNSFGGEKPEHGHGLNRSDDLPLSNAQIDPDSRPQLSMRIRQVHDLEDGALAGFIETYQQAFAGAPYFERFSVAEVRQIWQGHLQGNGCVIVTERFAEADPSIPAEVVGIACALPLASPHAGGGGEFIRDLRAREEPHWVPNRTMYISELACKSSIRGQGYGTKLTEALLQWGRSQGYNDWVTRTAADGSNSIRIFQRAGGRIFGPRHDVTAEGVATESKQRVYLEGHLNGVAHEH